VNASLQSYNKDKKKIKVAIRNSKLNNIPVTNFTRTSELNRTTDLTAELSILTALV